MSLYRDPRCVFVSERFGTAETLAVILADQGIPAEVMDPMTRGGFEGLTPLLPGSVSARGVEIWVNNIDDADRARDIIAKKQADDLARAAKTGSMVFDCDDCAKQIIFPATLEGTVQECPHCHAYVDVPDADPTDGDEDYGTPEMDDA